MICVDVKMRRCEAVKQTPTITRNLRSDALGNKNTVKLFKKGAFNRRKFRSQTSDNMDRWKAEMGRVREEKRRRKKIKKRKSEKKEDPGARKGRKVAKHCVFPMICGSGGSKSRLAKAAGAEPAGQMRDEKLRAIVARSTLPSQNVKNWRVQSTFGRCDVEKVDDVVARSTSPSENVQSTSASEHFGSCDVEKVHAVVARSTFRVKIYKAPHVRATFGRWSVVLRGRRKGLCTLSKISKTWGFRSISKNDGRRRTFEEDLHRCISRGRRSTQDMFIRDVRR